MLAFEESHEKTMSLGEKLLKAPRFWLAGLKNRDTLPFNKESEAVDSCRTVISLANEPKRKKQYPGQKRKRETHGRLVRRTSVKLVPSPIGLRGMLCSQLLAKHRASGSYCQRNNVVAISNLQVRKTTKE
jgi:hypothetical protein